MSDLYYLGKTLLRCNSFDDIHFTNYVNRQHLRSKSKCYLTFKQFQTCINILPKQIKTNEIKNHITENPIGLQINQQRQIKTFQDFSSISSDIRSIKSTVLDEVKPHEASEVVF